MTMDASRAITALRAAHGRTVPNEIRNKEEGASSKKKILYIFFSIVFSIAMFACSDGNGDDDDYSSSSVIDQSSSSAGLSADSLKKVADGYKNVADSLKVVADGLKDSNKGLSDSLKAVADTLAAKTEKLNDLGDRISDLEADADASQSTIADLIAEAQKQLEEIKKLMEEMANPTIPGGDGSNGVLLMNFTNMNYQTGILRWADLSANTIELEKDSILFDQDSKIVTNGNKAFVLQKTLGTLVCLSLEHLNDIAKSPTQAANKNYIKEVALEDGANPYNIAFVGSTGYIALYGLDYIQAFDVNTCALGKKINLPALTGDKMTNAADIVSNNGELLVLLQRLNGWVADEPGLLVRINAAGTVTDTIQLKLYNPRSAVVSGGKLFVGATDYNDASNYDYAADNERSGLEVVDLAAGTSAVALSGDVSGFGLVYLTLSGDYIYASSYIEYLDGPVLKFPISNPATYEYVAYDDVTDAAQGTAVDTETGNVFIADAMGLLVWNGTDANDVTIKGGKKAATPYSLAIARW